MVKFVPCKTLQNEHGYLYEIPLLTILIAVACAVLIKVLPMPWNLIPLVILVVAVGFFLYYNFLRPGWLPGKRR